MPPRRRTKPRSPLHRSVGEAITILREDAGLTLEELADRASMRFQLVSDLERGVTDPKLSTLERICGGLQIEISGLLHHAEGIRRSGACKP